MKQNQNAGNKIDKYMDSVSATEKEEIDDLVARFFFGCNIPFSTVESDNFKNLVKKLRPAYKPPCRKTLASSLLDNVHRMISMTDTQNLGKESVLLIDGWKNSAANSKNVVCMLHTSDNKRAFLEAFDFTSLSESGVELAKVVEQCITIARTKFKTEVYCVVSDNARNMVKMGTLINIWFSNCNSHTGNLLAKDVDNKSENLLSQITPILKDFKQPKLEKSLIDLGGSKVLLPAETRWCSSRDCFQSFIENLSFMKQLAAVEENPQTKLKSENKIKLFDDNLIANVKKQIKILDPICALINTCQKSDCSLGEAAEEWLKLELPNRYDELLEKRKKMALTTLALAANRIHPLYRGNRLSKDQLAEVEIFFLDNLDVTGLQGYQRFIKSEGIFDVLNKKIGLPGITYWEFAARHFQDISSLALKLLRIPSSSAQLERLFSNWSYIHSNVRNRLGFERSKKLTNVYYSLKVADTNKTDEY